MCVELSFDGGESYAARSRCDEIQYETVKDEHYATSAYRILFIYFKIKEKEFTINYMTKFSKDANKIKTQITENGISHIIQVSRSWHLIYTCRFDRITAPFRVNIWNQTDRGIAEAERWKWNGWITS